MTTTTINYFTFHLLFEFHWYKLNSRIKWCEEREYNPNYRTLTVFKGIEFADMRGERN